MGFLLTFLSGFLPELGTAGKNESEYVRAMYRYNSFNSWTDKKDSINE